MPILRGVGSQILACGCLVGLYERYDGRVIGLVDAQSPLCSNPSHRVNAAMPIPVTRKDEQPRPSGQ